MALAANALLSVEDVRIYLDIQGGSDGPIEEEINRCTEIIEGYCDRPLKKATYTAVRVKGPWTPELYLKAAPLVIAVGTPITVSVNGTAQTVWTAEADGDPDDFDVVVGSSDHTTRMGQRNLLYRYQGWASTSSRNPYNVLLTYTAGLDPIPEDLKEAALLFLQKLWRDRQKQLADVSTLNTPSGSVTILDRIPILARKTLDDRYKRWTVG